MARLESLDSLLVDGLKDLLDAERKLAEALPQMARMAVTPGLRTAFEDLISHAEHHASRLLEALQTLGASMTRDSMSISLSTRWGWPGGRPGGVGPRSRGPRQSVRRRIRL